jgi:hypothetical protein
MATKPFWMCTMCEHWHAGRAKQQPCGHPACHGPIAGGWFPDYRGPLRAGTDNAWQWCFFCGNPASHVLRVATHYLGVCEGHLAHVQVRTRKEDGVKRDVFTPEGQGQLACDDAELRGPEAQDRIILTDTTAQVFSDALEAEPNERLRTAAKNYKELTDGTSRTDMPDGGAEQEDN